MTKLTNSFATKADLRKLKSHFDNKFKSVDKRFEQVDKRFEQVDKRFTWFRSEIKSDLEIFRKDTFRTFENRWQQFIDPILKEIKKHREKEIIMAEQYQRTQSLLKKIALKVGVDI